MTRLTKRLRDQLVDIEKAKRKKEGKLRSDADLAAVRAVTARLKEGLEPPRAQFDPTIFQQMVTGLSASWAKQMQTKMARANILGSLLSAQINRPRMSRNVPGMIVIDDINTRLILDDPLAAAHDDAVDALRYALFLVVIDRGADFGVVQTNITA